LEIEELLEKEQRRLARRGAASRSAPVSDSNMTTYDLFAEQANMKKQSMGAVQYYATYTDDRSKLPVDDHLFPSTRSWDIPTYVILSYSLPLFILIIVFGVDVDTQRWGPIH
jgi:hypothetical protein